MPSPIIGQRNVRTTKANPPGGSRAASGQGRLTFNWRLFIGTVVAVAVGAPTLYALHGFQVSRTADAFLDRAAELERDGEARLAANYINRYQRFRPSEEGVLTNLAWAYDRAATDPAAKRRASQFYYRAIGVTQDQSHLIRLQARLAELLLEASRADRSLLVDAEQQAGELPEPIDDSEINARVWRVYAISRAARVLDGGLQAAPVFNDGTIGAAGSKLTVAESLEKALALTPHDAELATTLAIEAYRKPERFATVVSPDANASDETQFADRADEIVNQCVAARRDALVSQLQELGILEEAPSDAALVKACQTAFSAFDAALEKWALAFPAKAQQNFADRLVSELRAGGSVWLRKTTDEALPKISAYAAGDSVSPLPEADARAAYDWFLANDREAITRLVLDPLRESCHRYAESLTIRQGYAAEYDVPSPPRDLEIAVALAPEDVRLIQAAARWRFDRCLAADDADAAAAHAMEAERLLRMAIELQPRDEFSYLLLGELMFKRPDRKSGPGDGIVDVADEFQVGLAGESSILVHFEGDDNDIRVAPSGDEARFTSVTVKPHAEELSARYAKFGKVIEIGVPDADVSANDLIQELNTLPGVDASIDNQIDTAVSTWRAGLRATQRRSVGLAVRVAEALTRLGQGAAAERALVELDEVIDRVDNPNVNLDVFRRQRSMLAANLAMSGGEPATGVKQLEKLLADATSDGDSEEQSRVWAALARAYASNRNWGKSARAYEELAVLNPSDASFRESAALSWARGGNFARASSQYRKALAVSDSPEMRLALTRSLLEQQQQLAAEDQEWAEFDAALKELLDANVAGELEDPWRVDLIRVDAALAKADASKRQLASARMLKALRAIERKYEDEPRLLERLSVEFEDLDAVDDVNRVLDRWATLADDAAGVVDVALRRSAVASARGELPEARRVLEEAMLTTPEVAAKPLQEALLRLDFKMGDVGRASEQLASAHEKDPTNPEPIARLAEIALGSGDQEEFERWFDILQKLEGEDGVGVRLLRAQELLAGVEDATDPDIDKAESLLRSVVAENPRVASARWVLAQIAERRGDFDSAIGQYEAMRQSGQVFGRMFEKLIAARARRGEFEQAGALLADAARRGFNSPRLDGLKMLVDAGAGRLDDALANAKQAAADAPDDPALLFRYGTLLASAQDVELNRKALVAFERCLELDSADPRSWNALVMTHARLQDRAAARAVLERMQSERPGDPLQLNAALSVGYQAIGDLEEATRYCRLAVAGAADEPTLRLRLAQLVRETDPAESESLARAVLEDRPDFGPARQFLAALLNESGDFSAREEALALLTAEEGDDASAEDLRLKAKLLIEQGGSARRVAARQAVEAIASTSGSLTDQDRFTLAMLYESEGRFREARREYTLLIGRENPQPAHLSRYAAMLIRRQDFSTARRMIEKLEQLAPDAPAMVELYTKYFESQGQREKAVTYLANYVKRVGAMPEANPATLARWSGDLCTSLDFHSDAEGYYRKLRRVAPEEYGPLAICLANQRKVDEALKLCLDAAENAQTPKPAIAIAGVLLTGRGSSDHYETARPVLKAAEDKFPDSVELRLMLANMHIVTGEPREAERLYRSILARDKENLLALNNLAAILAEEAESRDEALRLIERGLRFAEARGVPASIEALLVDTKGSILLYRGKHNEALEFLVTATQLSPTEPIYQLHLAAAYQRGGNDDAASRALASARVLGLDDLPLSRVDRQLLRDLEQISAESGPGDFSSLTPAGRTTL